MKLKEGDIVKEFSTEVYAGPRCRHQGFTAFWLVMKEIALTYPDGETPTGNIAYRLYLLQTNAPEGIFKPGMIDEVGSEELVENKSIYWTLL